MATNPKTRAGTKPRPQCFIARTIAYPPSMAKPPWARLTKPIKPMVTERPTDTMNSTMPAATPPRSMLATSTPEITRELVGDRRGIIFRFPFLPILNCNRTFQIVGHGAFASTVFRG